MKKAFIIHGAFGNPEENWFPWLKKELEKINYQVISPIFPTPKNQTLENWEKIISKYENDFDKQTIFIGHSLGPAFILSILEKIKNRVKAVFFVSGFVKLLENETFDTINQTFVKKEFDWKKINSNCEKFFIYHSDNDPYVPIENAYELKEKLNAKLTIIKNAGHFNEASGYLKFEEILEDIKKNLRK